MHLRVYVRLGGGAGEGDRVCLDGVLPPTCDLCSWGSTVGEARLEDVPHLASRDGPLLLEGSGCPHA